MANKKSQKPTRVTDPLAEEARLVTTHIPSRKPLVFISHDSRDADLAEAFSNLLTDASGGILKSFRSSDRRGTAGIEFGAEWYKAIMEKLADASDVVALLTQHSIDRPWILYEAGVAKGKLDSTVFGVAIGVPLEKASVGPFAQFQNSADDEDSLLKLVVQLIKKNPEAAPREEAVARQVKAFRENVTGLVKTRSNVAPQSPARVDETAVAKLFEEVKLMFRDLPEQLEGKLKTVRHSGHRRTGRIHLHFSEEVLFHSRFNEGPDGRATSWLIFISALRDDLPFIYELGIQVLRALRAGEPRRTSNARDSLLQILDGLTRGPFLEEMMGSDAPDFYRLIRRLLPMIDDFLGKAIAEMPQTARRPRIFMGQKAKDASEETTTAKKT